MFTTPLGLLALLGVPAVVVLHLYRRRLVERRVAGLFLFAGERLVADAGRTRTRLLRTPSLWLECLAALALALWLGGLSFGGARARHVVFVLDDSASMQVGGARARALAAVQQHIADLSGSDRATVLLTGPRPGVLAGPRCRPEEVAPGLEKWSPVRTRHDVLPTIDLARELAAGEGEVVFCTDEEPPVACGDITVLAFGQAAPNCAVLSAERAPRAAGDGENLRLRLGGFGAVAFVEFAVHAGPRELLRRRVELREGIADEAVQLPPELGALRVQLTDDALALDNVAWLLPAPIRTVAVCDLLDDELRARLQLPRVFGALSGFRREADSRAAQLVLGKQPGQLVVGQTEVLIDPGNGERDAYAGPFVIDRAHPWLAGVQLQGVVWLAGRAELPGQVLVAVGGQALMTEQFLDAGRRLWIDLDAKAGNLPRSPDWPVLFANLLDTCRAEVPGPVASNVLLGEEALYRRSMLAGGTDASVALVAPDGTRRDGRGGRTVSFVLEQPGLHALVGAGGEPLCQFAARFVDPAESDLRGLRTASWPRGVKVAGAHDGSLSEGPARDGAALRDRASALRDSASALRDRGLEQRILACLLLVFVLADWWLLARRRA